MDRFIAQTESFQEIGIKQFKIQYGQIYRSVINTKSKYEPTFKIQYGQIYRPLIFKITKFFVDLKSNMDRFIVWCW